MWRTCAVAIAAGVAAAGACGMAACGAWQGPASGAPVLARLSRGACLGECPIYIITVYEDGVVQYDGRDFVEARGRYTATLDAAGLARLRDAFQTARFSSLGDFVHPDCTDQAIATLEYGGRTLRHDHGDKRAPEELFELEASFDRIVGSERWVGSGVHTVFGYFCP